MDYGDYEFITNIVKEITKEGNKEEKRVEKMLCPLSIHRYNFLWQKHKSEETNKTAERKGTV